MRFAFLASLAVFACNRAPSAPGPLGSAAPSASAPQPAASLARERPLPDGCWMEVDRDAELGALSSALFAACAPGMRSVAKAEARDVGEGGQSELSFSAPSGGLCVRAIAVGSPEIRELELELSDASGRVHARGELDARFELVGARGPVCLSAGAYRAIATARRGAGRLRLELVAPAE